MTGINCIYMHGRCSNALVLILEEEGAGLDLLSVYSSVVYRTGS